MSPPAVSHCIPWLVVLGTECLVIVILNIMTIIVFVKQRHLQRKSTYLIIHLAVVDLLVGAVSGPQWIKYTGGVYCKLWEYDTPDNEWLFIIESAIGRRFYQASLLNLAFISLERTHATFRPLKHRFIKKWVYGVIIIVIWLIPAVMIVSVYGLLFHIKLNCKWPSVLFSYCAILLFVIVVCYVSIYIKVRLGRHPQNHSAAGLRERKLTSTLFLVTFGSLLTLLPLGVYYGTAAFDLKLVLSFSLNSFFHIDVVKVTFLLLNSFINPIIYAIRMPELRAGILQIIFRRAPRRSNGAVNIPLQVR